MLSVEFSETFLQHQTGVLSYEMDSIIAAFCPLLRSYLCHSSTWALENTQFVWFVYRQYAEKPHEC